MAQPWEARRDTAFAAANLDATEGSTMRLAGVQADATGIPTQRLPDSAVAEDLPETLPLPAIDLLPTVKRSAIKAPSAAPAVPRRRLVSVLVTLGVFLVVNVAMQFNRNYFDAASDGYYGMKRIAQCESLGRAPDVIYAGSSRTVYGVNPKLIDNLVHAQTGKSVLGCNDATFGSTIDHDYFMFKKLIDDGYAPKVLVENAWEYPLNVHAIGSHGTYSAADLGSLTLSEAPWIANVGDAYDLRQKYKVGANGTLKWLDFTLSRVAPIYGDRYGLLNMLCQGSTVGPCAASLPGVDSVSLSRYQSSDPQGYVPLTGKSLASLDAAGIAQAKHEYSYGKNLHDFKVGGGQEAYLKKMIELAQAHHVKVILVTSPLDPIFFSYLKPFSDWKNKIVPFWQSIAAEYHIHYYDESQSKAYSAADFWDPEHLDITGATKYSSWLAQTVVGPALNG